MGQSQIFVAVAGIGNRACNSRGSRALRRAGRLPVAQALASWNGQSVIGQPRPRWRPSAKHDARLFPLSAPRDCPVFQARLMSREFVLPSVGLVI